jgi:hypothetical protein
MPEGGGESKDKAHQKHVEQKKDGGAAEQKTGGAASKFKSALDLAFSNVKEYADDPRIYEPRLDTIAKFEYWDELKKNKIKKLPSRKFVSWDDRRKTMITNNELMDYALPRRILLNFTVHVIWDYFYLSWLLIWMLAMIIVHDKLAIRLNLPLEIFASLPPGAVHLPMLFMFLSQIPPCFGAFYFTHFCNDLIKCRARENFSFWAFNAVLICQYIEFSFYGGQNRTDWAGKCRNQGAEGWIFRAIMYVVNLFTPKVSPTADEDENAAAEQQQDYDEFNEENYDWDADTLNSGTVTEVDQIMRDAKNEEMAADISAAEYMKKVRDEKETAAKAIKLEGYIWHKVLFIYYLEV